MIKKILLPFSLLFFALCLSPPVSLAHKVRIFAYTEGSSIIGETSFSGGKKPKNSEIIVQDAVSAKTLFTSRTNEQGLFRFPIPPEALRNHLDLRIIINASDGHRGEWLLETEDYLADGQGEPASSETSTGKVEGNMADQEAIRLIVEEAMDKKLGPIKHMLVSAQIDKKKPTFRDILGGIGYILGLAGIAAYFQAKNMLKKTGTGSNDL